MAKFAFSAKSADGKDYKGEVEAASEIEARVKLRAQKLVPVKLSLIQTVKSNSRSASGVTPKDLQIFTRQLATLLGSGIPIMQSIDVLAKGAKSPGLKKALNDVVNQVGGGKRFADALAVHHRVFDRFYVNMIRAGEESGNMDKILLRLATYIEKSVAIKGKVKGAMVYPGVIIFVASVVVSALMIFVIPKFETLFKGAHQELPALTQMVLNVSRFFIHYWYLIFASIGGTVFALIKYGQTEEGKKVFDRILIDMPLMGSLLQKSGVARFTRTLSTLLESGVGIIEALEISSRTAGNTVLENILIRCRESISEGKSLTAPLLTEKYIPQMVVQMISVGEQTGALDQMLSKVADFYEEEVNVAVGALTSVMEPLLMVVLGIIIAVIVIAMYLPIFNMAGAIGA